MMVLAAPNDVAAARGTGCYTNEAETWIGEEDEARRALVAPIREYPGYAEKRAAAATTAVQAVYVRFPQAIFAGAIAAGVVLLFVVGVVAKRATPSSAGGDYVVVDEKI